MSFSVGQFFLQTVLLVDKVGPEVEQLVYERGCVCTQIDDAIEELFKFRLGHEIGDRKVQPFLDCLEIDGVRVQRIAMQGTFARQHRNCGQLGRTQSHFVGSVQCMCGPTSREGRIGTDSRGAGG